MLYSTTFVDCFIRLFCHINTDVYDIFGCYLYKTRVKELLSDDTHVIAKPHSTSQEGEEEGYYSSYTHFGIHEEMLRVCVTHKLLSCIHKFVWGTG